MDAELTRRALAEAVARAKDMAKGRAVVWGEDDCSPWAASILRDVLGYDAIAPWRGTYRNRAGAEVVLAKTGIIAGLRRAAKLHGWRRIAATAAAAGDIGAAMTACGPVTSIFDGVMWVSRIDFGVAYHQPGIVRPAWSVIDGP